MSNLPSLFINNLFPILLIAGIGFLSGKYLKIEARSISRIIFYVFSPCLIFNLITTSKLSGDDMLKMVGFASAVVLSCGLITFTLGKMIKLDRKMLAAVILTTMTTNSGNFGLSLNLFAFGEAGLAQASIFFVTSAMITYSVGVAIASMGTVTFSQSLKKLLTIPTIYAVLLAVIFVTMKWELPTPLVRATSTLAEAAIPAMLMLLGLQFQQNQRTHHLKALALSTGMRLFGGAALGIILASVFNLPGVAYQAGIIQAATPTAVLSTVLATEFDIEPAFVTMVVFTTTLLSPFTLTPLLAYLGA